MRTTLLIGSFAVLLTAVGCDRNRSTNVRTTPETAQIATKGPPMPEPVLPRPSTADEAIDNEEATNADVDRGTDTLGGGR